MAKLTALDGIDPIALRTARDQYSQDVRDRLLDNVEQLFNYFEAKPSSKRSRNRAGERVFWGRKQSLAVWVSGPRRGNWINREAGVGGGVFKAIGFYAGIRDFPSQIEWAANWLGIPPFDAGGVSQIDHAKIAAQLAARRAAEEEAKRIRAEEEARQETRRRNHVYGSWEEATAIAPNSAADIYIRQTRLIPVAQYPASMRWHDKMSAILFAITEPDGTFRTVQAVAVTPEGEKDNQRIWNPYRPEDKRAKNTFSTIGQSAALRLPGPSDGPLFIGEGPETTLSGWSAGYEAIATIGPITYDKIVANITRDRKVIIAQDDDAITGGNNAKREYERKRLIRRLRREGYNVIAIKPFEVRRQDKSDFNDLIKEQGVDGVRARIETFIKPQVADIQYMNRVEAGDKLDALIEANMHSLAVWRRETDSEFAPAISLKVTAGVGKTAAYIRAIKPVLNSMRERGDLSAINIALPFHDLADDIKERYHNHKQFDAAVEEAQAEAGGEFRIAGYRGREAKQPHSNELMCGNIEVVREAYKLHVRDITKEVCNAECPLRDTCPYLAQRNQTADIWLVSHSRLFAKMPAPISKTGAAMMIVDETAWLAGFVPDSIIPVRDIEDMPLGDGFKHDIDRFADIRARVVAAVIANGEGPLTALNLSAQGLDIESAQFAKEREHLRLIIDGPWRERVANETLGPMLRLWGALEELFRSRKAASGWLRVERDDANRLVLCVRTTMNVSKDWRIPTLHVDASADVEVLRHFWPGLIDGGRFDVDVANTKIYQVVDRSFAKSQFEQISGVIDSEDPERIKKAEQEDISRAKERRRLRAFIAKLHRSHDGETLVIANKAVKEGLNLDAIPGIVSGHYNAIAGKDKWGQVSAAVMIGRTQPPITETTRMAEAMTGDIIEHADRYQRRDGVRIARRGDQLVEARFETETHPHPMAERIRHRICEGEVYQALHRCRPVNRGPDRPVTIYLLNDLAIDIPVDGFIDADAIRYPTPRDMMLGEGGIAYEAATSATMAYPTLWSSPKALGMALTRHRKAEAERGVIPANRVTSPYNKLSIGWRYSVPETAYSPLPADAGTNGLVENSVSSPYEKPFIGSGNAVPSGAEFSDDGLVRVQFQRRGPKLHREAAYIDPRRVTDPRGAIEAQLGPLAWFEGPATGQDLAPIEPPAAMPARIAVGQDMPVWNITDRREPIVLELVPAAIAPDPEAPPPPKAPTSVSNDTGVAQPVFDQLPEDADDDDTEAPDVDWPAVRARLRDTGISHGDLATRCGVSQPHLSNMERGFRRPTAAVAAALEAFLRETPPIQERLF